MGKITYDEFEDCVMDYIHENVFPAGDELDFHRKYKENMQKLYDLLIGGI